MRYFQNEAFLQVVLFAPVGLCLEMLQICGGSERQMNMKGENAVYDFEQLVAQSWTETASGF